jgi:GTPase Era involved in 16S rRNA processing
MFRTLLRPASLPSLRLSLLGPPNSGKSSLLSSLFPTTPYLSAISPKSHTTRSIISSKLLLPYSDIRSGSSNALSNVVINVSDTPGLVYDEISGADRGVLPRDIKRMLESGGIGGANANDSDAEQHHVLCVLDAARLHKSMNKAHNRTKALPRWSVDVVRHAIRLCDASGGTASAVDRCSYVDRYSYVLNKVDMVADKKGLLEIAAALVEVDEQVRKQLAKEREQTEQGKGGMGGKEGRGIRFADVHGDPDPSSHPAANTTPTIFMVSCTVNKASGRGSGKEADGGIDTVRRWLVRAAKRTGLTEDYDTADASGGVASGGAARELVGEEEEGMRRMFSERHNEAEMMAEVGANHYDHESDRYNHHYVSNEDKKELDREVMKDFSVREVRAILGEIVEDGREGVRGLRSESSEKEWKVFREQGAAMGFDLDKIGGLEDWDDVVDDDDAGRDVGEDYDDDDDDDDEEELYDVNTEDYEKYSDEATRNVVALLETPDKLLELREGSREVYEVVREKAWGMGIDMEGELEKWQARRGSTTAATTDAATTDAATTDTATTDERATKISRKNVMLVANDEKLRNKLKESEPEIYEAVRKEAARIGVKWEAEERGEDDVEDGYDLDDEDYDLYDDYDGTSASSSSGGSAPFRRNTSVDIDEESPYTPSGDVHNPTVLFTELLKQVCYEYLYKELPYRSQYHCDVDLSNRVVDFVVVVERESQRKVVESAIRGKIHKKVTSGVMRVGGGGGGGGGGWKVGSIRAKVARRNKA